MKKIFIFIFSGLLFTACHAQKNPVTSTNSSVQKTKHTNPKLVVGIVVDQMRYDYLTRFYNKYSNGGFKRLMQDGFNFKNNHFNYIPTYTGPGHASVFTGTTPKYHGIIANNWYDKESKEFVYCAGDDAYTSLGTRDDAGHMSPHRMQTTSFADENRLFTQMKGKTIGIAVKDRGAVLPAGHTANGAYWFHGKDQGNWISSSFYGSELPTWVKDFNSSNASASYLKVWNTLYPIETYTESGPDLNTFEGGFKGQENPTFPYDLAALKNDNKGFDILKATPYGNSLTTDFAIAAVAGEDLGKDAYTDVLTLSYSSTDYVGHNFGVSSKEIQDTYLRLDLDLERFFKYLDETVGAGEYTVFLTSDHGAVEVPSFLKSVNIPSGYLNNKETKQKFNTFMTKTYSAEDLIENVSNNQIFLNRQKITELGLNLADVQATIINELITYKNIDKVYSASTMSTNSFTIGIEHMLQNGYHQKRSGDILMVPDAAYISYSLTGSTHGSGFNYDTHVPLLFFGKGIKKGSSFEKTVISDIAPTISALLGISFPSGTTGRPLGMALEAN